MTQFTVNAKDLSDALGLLLTVAEPKGTIPVLAFTLLESKDNSLRLSATDIGRSVITKIVAGTDEPFSLCVPMKQFHDLAALLQGDLKISQHDKGLQVIAGKSRYVLPIMEADKFPMIDKAEGDEAIINGELLASMLSAVLFAAGRNPNLERWSRTLLIEAANGKLSITACNGPQLANTQTGFTGEFTAMISHDSVKPLASLASRSGDLALGFNERFLTARTETTFLGLQLSGDKWPDWKMLLKPSYAYSAEFEIQPLGLALRRSVLTCDPALSVKGVNFELGKESVCLAASGYDRGEGNESVDIRCPSLNGDTVTTRLDGNMLLEALRTLKTGTALWQFGDGAVPRFTPKLEGAFSFQYLQNPLHL
jgi:DNA polymerase-3 subunit beta